MQIGVHPLRAIVLTGLTPSVLKWLESLDGTRELERVLREAVLAGLDETRARSLLDQLAAQGALHDASAGPGCLREIALAERDRMKPDLDALDLGSTAPDGMYILFERRRRSRVRVYGAGRIGAQVVAQLAAAGVGNIRVLDPGQAKPADISPGGLTWAEVGMSREAGAVAVARRLISGGLPPVDPDEFDQATLTGASPPPTPGIRPPRPATPPARTSTPPARTGTPPARTGTPPARTGTPPAQPPRQVTGGQPPRPGTGGQPPRPAASARPTRSAAEARPYKRTAGGQPPRTAVNPRAPRSGADEQPARSGAEAQPYRWAAEGRSYRPTVNVQTGGTYLGDRSDRPDLVILAPVAPFDRVLVNELLELNIPHLLVAAFEGHGTVGPLVLPGRTACLHCIDLTHRDHDPHWGLVTALLGGYPPGEIACDAALSSAVAGTVVGHALAFLDGREPVVTNGTMEVTPEWRWRRRSWKRHPQCRCMRNNPCSLTMDMAPDHD